MKNTNITEINMDLLEKVTGGTIGTCDPAIGKTGPLEWYDSINCETGPLDYPYKAVGPINAGGPVKAVGPVKYPY